jgi:hypothetical protein
VTESKNWFYTRTADGAGWTRLELPLGGVPAGPGVAVAPLPTFTLGLDLGQVSDYSALVLAETVRVGAPGPQSLLGQAVYHHELTAIRRYPLGTAYPDVVAHVCAVCAGLPTPPLLVVDQTGVGRAVVDVFARARPRCRRLVPVTIVSGQGEAYQPDGSFHVAKTLLVGKVQVALQADHLRAAPELPEASTLVAELRGFKARITASGNTVFGAAADWRENSHDDLVLATALSVWGAEYVANSMVQSF